MLFISSGCGSLHSNNFAATPDNTNNQTDTDNQTDTETQTDTTEILTSSDIETTQELSATGSNTHAILASADTASYSNLGITKTGDSSGEDADFYGTNAAVLAANGVFSYGSGTTVNVSDTVIITRSNNSGGIMTTGGGTMNAENLTIETSGGSSAAIRSDRGGGTINVNNGRYTRAGITGDILNSRYYRVECISGV